ncbi:29037_t:CDS:2, partial [Gigaspora margarita]
GTCPDREESRRWKQKFELITEVPPQINVLDSSTVLNIAVDDSPIRYDKFIKGINNAREDKTACLTLYASTNPLCWGIIDLRANNVAPCPNHPRAGEFFSDIEVQKLQQTCNEIIKKYSQLNSSVIELLEVLQSKTFSLKKFSKEKRARGIKGVCSLLRIETDMVDIYDKDTQYIGECLDVFGESHSTADRDEKSFRSKCERTGKACDFLFWKNGYEIGIGENTGPMNKDHYKKSVTDFVSVIKVARAQHINFQTKCIEESGINPLPPEIENDLKLISIPFFQVIGMKIRFYILIQVDGDLYGIWEWSSQDLPTKEDDIISVVLLCKKFLIHRNLLNRTGQLSKTVIKNSQIFRENIENAEFVHYNKKSVKL